MKNSLDERMNWRVINKSKRDNPRGLSGMFEISKHQF